MKKLLIFTIGMLLSILSFSFAGWLEVPGEIDAK
jgi:hypothetical protein